MSSELLSIKTFLRVTQILYSFYWHNKYTFGYRNKIIYGNSIKKKLIRYTQKEPNININLIEFKIIICILVR